MTTHPSLFGLHGELFTARERIVAGVMDTDRCDVLNQLLQPAPARQPIINGRSLRTIREYHPKEKVR